METETKRVKPLDNSDICVDRDGNVGIIASLQAGGAVFHRFDEEGNTEEPTVVAIEELTRAPLNAIPPTRRAVLADVQWAELGHE